VSLLVWILTLDLSGLGETASSYATAGIALEIIAVRKPHRHDKAETLPGSLHYSRAPIIRGPIIRGLRLSLICNYIFLKHSQRCLISSATRLTDFKKECLVFLYMFFNVNAYVSMYKYV
jgi:hypothetical protein